METAIKTIRFGLGEVISDQAMSGRYPAVTLEPSLQEPGIVGTKGPDLPSDELRPGSTVLEFHGKEGAMVLIEDIVLSLEKSGHSLYGFLSELANRVNSKAGA